jgi:hypothetical protein
MRMSYRINQPMALIMTDNKSYQLEEEHIDELQKRKGLSSG